MRIRNGRTPRWPLALAAAGALLLSACADFEERAAGQTFAPAPEMTPKAGPRPDLPEVNGGSGDGQPGPRTSPTPIPPPQGCTDFDKAVVETCLDTVSAVAALPTDGSAPPNALAAERKSGRVLRVAANTDPDELAKLDVDAAGDGGLTGLALSPSYPEDQLVFAYVTTASDNRVVRLAKGQPPKPILTGIPKGATGNRGAIMPDGKGALLVATGDAGNPSAAAEKGSLAGKVLRIDPGGQPAKGNPQPESAVVATGLHSPGGLCKSGDGARLWVTDRTPDKDVVHRIQLGASLSVPAWTWPDKPGVGGCADSGNAIDVATTAAHLQILPITPDGAVGGKPSTALKDSNYGRLSGMDAIDQNYAFASTVNKDGGTPVSSDDRVVLVALKPITGGGIGKD
ncbi:PQQ-dependent sugar dehydrogenase [Amycolatopsis anabasis]|uniref:PQQ-dependent sugar dehydrogenase n=1 Tax=Amycolatopsis anabasis TaxID=1840409 RepID=UPI00131E0D0C|nr:PQQ-dependent sugar dehydrogenase [Amycolatopsis anabasis]